MTHPNFNFWHMTPLMSLLVKNFLLILLLASDPCEDILQQLLHTSKQLQRVMTANWAHYILCMDSDYKSVNWDYHRGNISTCFLIFDISEGQLSEKLQSKRDYHRSNILNLKPMHKAFVLS